MLGNFIVRPALLKASCGCEVNLDLLNIQTPTGKILMESDNWSKDFAQQTNWSECGWVICILANVMWSDGAVSAAALQQPLEDRVQAAGVMVPRKV